ncbi:melatonin receptor type 1B-like [Montipora capricornis]|uniref:melatonin receptor type 1B-like n=1 Tax=Montipora capricornis TaxID=246305 RepID=UPI0035F10C50
MASTTTSNLIEALLLVAICMASVLGNALMFVVFLRRKQLRTISNGYLLNLAFADLLVSVLNMPVTVVTIMEQRWIFGETACDLLGFTTMLSFVSSVMSLAMIAINRYYYVVRWKTYHTIFTQRKSVLFGSTVWLLSSLISLPPLFGWADYRYIPGKSYCFVFWPSDVYYMYFMLTICFFGPLTVMSVSYFHILKFTRQSRQRVEQHREDNLKPYNWSREQENGRKIKRFTMSPEEVQITNTLLIVDVCFMVCWAPFAITMFIDVYHPNPLPRAIDIGTLLLGYANSMCNPLVYGTRNQAFRRELYRLYNDCISLCSRKSNVTSLEVPHSGTTGEGEPELTKFSLRLV